LHVLMRFRGRRDPDTQGWRAARARYLRDDRLNVVIRAGARARPHF
jgi:hypothetical protein